MIDNNDFDRETYKNIVDKIGLTQSKKQILLDKMREEDKKSENAKKKTRNEYKASYTIWIRAAAISLVLALIGGGLYLGFSNHSDNLQKSSSVTDTSSKSGNSFILSANAAEVDNEAYIGVFSYENNAQFLMKDFKNDNGLYRNKLGKVDYFNSFQLTDLQIQGSNIESVTFKSNKNSTYFLVDSYAFDNAEEDEEQSRKIYDRRYSNSEKTRSQGEFYDYDSLKNSQYTKEEFAELADGLYGEFCDSFTYKLKNPSENEGVIQLGELIEFVIETNRSDSEIDGWMEEYCELDSELHTLRAETRQIQGEYGEVTDEEIEIENKMNEINKKIIQKSTDGAVIDVKVKFTDGTTRSEEISVGMVEEGKENGVLYPWLTFKYAE